MRGWILLVFLLFSVTESRSADFNVTDTADGVDAKVGDGVCETLTHVCTLRAAIQEANATATTDRVHLPEGHYTLSLSGSGKGIMKGDLNITESLEIVGSGNPMIEASFSATDPDRIFNVRPRGMIAPISVSISGVALAGGSVTTANGGAILVSNASLSLSNLIIANNSAVSGGGLYFDGGITTTLGLSGVVFRGNSASSSGGALFIKSGTATIDLCEFTENTAASGGGAVTIQGAAASDPTVSFTYSSLYSNTATSDSSGGGIYVGTSTLSLVNSTLSGNTSEGSGGGIYQDGFSTTHLYSVTVAENVADSEANNLGDGGGAYVLAGSFIMKNTILAENEDLSTATIAPDCSGSVSAAGFDLLTDATGCTLAPAAGYTVVSDAKLDSLDYYGGSTKSHALQADSEAVDNGDVAGCVDSSGAALSTDQRQGSFSRSTDGNTDGTSRCDIGAYEYKACDSTGITSYTYLMAFHGCDTATATCTDPSNHKTYLAGSHDGTTWTQISAYTSISGSVPDIVYYNKYLYLFHTGIGSLQKLNSCFEEVSTETTEVSGGSDTMWVDPSLLLNGSELYLFYLPGILGTDPASCTSYPCTKAIHSAIANDASLTTFTQTTGDRVSVDFTSSGGMSDPDIVARLDGTYLMYVSSGPSTWVFTGSLISDTFLSPDGTSNRVISSNEGGVPSAIEVGTDIWLYVTKGDPATFVESIKRAVSPDGITPLTSADFTTVLDYQVVSGAASTFNVSSPSIMIWPGSDWSTRKDDY